MSNEPSTLAYESGRKWGKEENAQLRSATYWMALSPLGLVALYALDRTSFSDVSFFHLEMKLCAGVLLVHCLGVWAATAVPRGYMGAREWRMRIGSVACVLIPVIADGGGVFSVVLSLPYSMYSLIATVPVVLSAAIPVHLQAYGSRCADLLEALGAEIQATRCRLYTRVATCGAVLMVVPFWGIAIIDLIEIRRGDAFLAATLILLVVGALTLLVTGTLIIIAHMQLAGRLKEA